MSATQVQEGDKVSWNWNGNQPSGTAGEVKAGEVTVTSHRGNEISKTGDESNPAVHIERSGNDVVKTANELHVESKASENVEAPKEQPDQNPVKSPETGKKQGAGPESNGDQAKTGEKRKADEQAEGDAMGVKGEKEEAREAKKQKANNGKGDTANGDVVKKAPGRPKSHGEKKAPKKDKKAPVVGKSERKTRSQGSV